MVTATPKFDSVTIAVGSPNGKIYVTVLDDDDGRPIEVLIHAGKTGGPVHAWAASLARSITTSLGHGASINDIIEDLSLQTSDAYHRSADGTVIRSGAEAVCVALMQYRKAKYNELRQRLSGYDDDDYEPAWTAN